MSSHKPIFHGPNDDIAMTKVNYSAHPPIIEGKIIDRPRERRDDIAAMVADLNEQIAIAASYGLVVACYVDETIVMAGPVQIPTERIRVRLSKPL